MSRLTKLLCLILLTVSCASSSSPDKVANDPQEGFLTINGSSVFYKTIGEGDPLIIVHGGPVLDHSYLLPHFNELTNHYKLIFYDQRASGRSSVDIDTTSMSIAGFAEDIEQIRQKLNLGKVNILGHSWGGLLAMNYAIDFPGNIKSLILSNSTPASTEAFGEEQVILSSRVTEQDKEDRQIIIDSESFKKREPQAFRDLLLLSFKTQFVNRTFIDSLHLYIPDDMMQRSQLFGLMAKDVESYDLYDQLSGLKLPTLIIYGDDEPATSISATKLNETIPGSEMVIIQESGHFPFIEKRREYFSAINNFLGSI